MFASIALGLAFTLPVPKYGDTVHQGHESGRVRLAFKLVDAGSLNHARHPAIRPYLANDSKLGSEKSREAIATELRSRVMSAAPEWARQGRIDLLLEGSMYLRKTDRKEFAEIVRLMQGIAKPIAKKYLPETVTAKPDKDDPFAKTWDDRFLLKLDPSMGENKPGASSYPPWQFADQLRVTNKNSRSRVVVRANHLTVDWDSNTYGFFLVRDRISLNPRLEWEQEWVKSFVVCGGDVIAADLYLYNILIADGDVKLSSKIRTNRSSLVIATGDITTDLGLHTEDSCLIAGGRIKSYAMSNTATSVLYAGDVVDVIKGPTSKFGKHTPNFDFAKTGLKFFKLADLGLALEKVKDRVRVKSVDAKSPFHKSLQADDILLEVNNHRIESVNETRRIFRRATVLEYAIVTVRRQDTDYKWIVYLPATPQEK